MQEQGFLDILKGPNVFWAAVCDAANRPDVARVSGLAPVLSFPQITFFLAEGFASSLLKILKPPLSIALLVTSMQNFESYQYKGICLSLRPCTHEEMEMQRRHLDGFLENLRQIKIPEAEVERISQLYFQQPSYAVCFKVEKIFSQTPRKDAGHLVFETEGTP